MDIRNIKKEARKNLKRNFIGVEINPKYFEVAKKRISESEQITLW